MDMTFTNNGLIFTYTSDVKEELYKNHKIVIEDELKKYSEDYDEEDLSNLDL